MKKLFLWSMIIAGLSLTFALLFSHFVPYSMDEFSLYHVLACHFYPNNLLNTFRVGCSEFDLKPPFMQIFLPLREYTYMGSLTSLYFSPVFLVWRDLSSVRFMGTLFLAVEALILGRLFKIDFKYILVGLICFFPYLFQHVIDTGVVGFQTTLFLLIYYLIKKWVSKPGKTTLFFALVLFVLGVWTKLTFTWYSLGIFGLLLTEIIINNKLNKQSLRKYISVSLLPILITVCLSLYLFLASDINSKPFIHEFLSDTRTHVNSPKDFLISFRPDWMLASPVIKSMLNPYEATQRIYEVARNTWLSIIYGIVIFFSVPAIALGVWRAKKVKNKENFLRTIALTIIFWLTVLFIYRSGRSWSIHHIILAYPLLIMSFLSLVQDAKYFLGRFKFFLILALFTTLNLFLFMTFSQQKVTVSNDTSAQTVNHLLADPQKANQYIYVVVDWGMYYTQSLFGSKQQLVIYIEPFNSLEQVTLVREMEKNKKRKALFIYNSKKTNSDIKLINNFFPGYNLEGLGTDSVWKVWIEK